MFRTDRFTHNDCEKRIIAPLLILLTVAAYRGSGVKQVRPRASIGLHLLCPEM